MKLINVEIQKRHYPGKMVGVMAEMTSNDQPSQIDLFEFELDRFKLTLDFIEGQQNFILQRRTAGRQQINTMARQGHIGNEIFRSVVINYLCTFNISKQIFNQLPNRSLGFMLNLNINDFQNPELVGMEYTMLKKVTKKLRKKGLL